LAALLNSSLGSGSGGSSDGQSSNEPGSDRLSLTSAGSSTGAGAATATGAGQGAGQQGAASSPFGALQGRGGAGGSSGSGAFGSSGAAGGSDFGQSTPRTPGSGGGNESGGGNGGTGKVKITADPNTNALLIYADRQSYRMIESALRQLDRPAIQVAIEATIAEVTLNNGLQYGVQYFLQNSNSGPEKGSAGFTTQATSAILSQVLPGANFLLGPQSNPRVVLSALSTKTNVKVLSNPSIVVLDNQVGTIQVGDQVPVATTQATLVGTTTSGLNGSAIPVANNIDYRNTGIILRVLPRVSASGNVTLQIEQEISNVSNNGSQGSLTPTISQRHIKSSVNVASGQTVVLGGLISNTENAGRSGIPLLSNLAFIGDLFAQNQTALNRTELVMFIRPQIIKDAIDAQAVAEQMRSKMLYSKPFRR
jgi:general secretion pathway protein D